MRGQFVNVPNGHLYYEQHGAGPDVVLLNGGLADVRMWDSTVAWLAGIARVTTWDYRDNGLSAPSYGPYSEIDDLLAVLDAAGIGRAVLVGCSDGGRRALGFAHRHPERVARVVVVSGSFGEFPDPTPAEEAARAIMRGHFARLATILEADGIPAAVTHDVFGWCPALDEAARRFMIGLGIANSRVLTMPVHHGVELDPPVKQRFAELQVPVTVVAGDRDFDGSRLWARRIADTAPDAELHVLPAADHLPMFSAAAEFRQLLTHEVTR